MSCSHSAIMIGDGNDPDLVGLAVIFPQGSYRHCNFELPTGTPPRKLVSNISELTLKKGIKDKKVFLAVVKNADKSVRLL